MSFCCLILLLISNAVRSNALVEKDVVAVDTIKAQLNQFCMNCQEVSLTKYLVVVTKLEEIVDETKNPVESEKVQFLLAKAYQHLAFKYYKNKIPKKEIYSSKIIQLLEKLVESSVDHDLLSSVLKILNNTHFEQISTHRKNPEKLSFWKERIGVIRKKCYGKLKHLDKFIAFNGLKILDQGSKASMEGIEAQQVGEMIQELYNLNLMVSKEERIRLQKIADMLLILIKNNKISQQDIALLKRAAIGVENHSSRVFRETNILDNIIWWCWIRSIKDEEELTQFLKNQIHSNRKDDVNRVITELGME